MYLLITCKQFLYVGLSRVGLRRIGSWPFGPSGRSITLAPKDFLSVEGAEISHKYNCTVLILQSDVK